MLGAADSEKRPQRVQPKLIILLKPLKAINRLVIDTGLQIVVRKL